MTSFHTLDKPTKKQAFNLLLDARNGEDLTSHSISMLLNYFAPPMPKIPKTVEQWAAKATAEKDLRPYLNSFLVDSGKVIATDGHRLHIGSTDMPDGKYDKKTLLPVEMEGTYPKYSRVIPETNDSDFAPLTASELAPCNDRFGDKNTPIHFYTIGGSNFMQSYVNDAMGGRECVFAIAQDKLVIKHDFGLAVVMAINIKKPSTEKTT